MQIQDEGGGFLLLYLDAAGEDFADTFHLTADDAKAQAAFEFVLGDDGWQDVDDD